MAFNPMVQDRSGQILAQGMEGLGTELSQGIMQMLKQMQQNGDQDQPQGGGTGSQNVGLTQYMNQMYDANYAAPQRNTAAAQQAAWLQMLFGAGSGGSGVGGVGGEY